MWPITKFSAAQRGPEWPGAEWILSKIACGHKIARRNTEDKIPRFLRFLVLMAVGRCGSTKARIILNTPFFYALQNVCSCLESWPSALRLLHHLLPGVKFAISGTNQKYFVFTRPGVLAFFPQHPAVVFICLLLWFATGEMWFQNYTWENERQVTFWTKWFCVGFPFFTHSIEHNDRQGPNNLRPVLSGYR